MSNLQAREVSADIGGTRYTIAVGFDMQTALLAAISREGKGSRIAVVSDDWVGKKWGAELIEMLTANNFKAELFTFPAGEKNKNQKTATMLQGELLEKRYGRDTLIVALGGGVVGDLAGYVAATYLRGVPYINVPTTVLAMVDSSIGGKVGVDTEHGKNTIGAFWQPRAVIDDLRYIEGLPKREIISGVLEAVKTFFTSDKEALSFVDALDLENPLSTPGALQEIAFRSAAFKAGVAGRDEREENERRILNFGHTIGHAVELLSGFTMPHGFAVGYGMLVETKIAEDLGKLPSEDCATVVAYMERFGITADGLKEFAVADIVEAMKSDKKARAGKAYFVLLESIGSVYKKDGQYAHAVDDAVVQRALESVR
jgi:3-dehydroquinate synthase